MFTVSIILSNNFLRITKYSGSGYDNTPSFKSLENLETIIVKRDKRLNFCISVSYFPYYDDISNVTFQRFTTLNNVSHLYYYCRQIYYNNDNAYSNIKFNLWLKIPALSNNCFYVPFFFAKNGLINCLEYLRELIYLAINDDIGMLYSLKVRIDDVYNILCKSKLSIIWYKQSKFSEIKKSYWKVKIKQ